MHLKIHFTNADTLYCVVLLTTPIALEIRSSWTCFYTVTILDSIRHFYCFRKHFWRPVWTYRKQNESFHAWQILWDRQVETVGCKGLISVKATGATISLFPLFSWDTGKAWRVLDVKVMFTRDRIRSDPSRIVSTLLTQDWFETGTVRFHIGPLS